MKLKFVMFHNKSNITAFFYMIVVKYENYIFTSLLSLFEHAESNVFWHKYFTHTAQHLE